MPWTDLNLQQYQHWTNTC